MAVVEVSLPIIGKTTNIRGFSVQEDATPIDPSSSTGGVGTITVNVNEEGADYPLLIGDVVLADGSRGRTSGIIRSVSSNDGAVTVAADSILGLFNADRTVPPYVGTLQGAVELYCSLVDVNTNIAVDASIADRPVIYPGGTGNLWVRVKQMLAAEQVEMSLVFNRISVRPLRRRVADLDRLSSSGWSVTNDQAARQVEVNYYKYTDGSQIEVYPNTIDEPQIIVVDANQTQVVRQTLNASLSSVNQPTPLFNVQDRPYPGTNGVYSVVGMDDLPIQPAQWTASGGYLRVRVTEDPSVIEIEVKGANIPRLGPFRIAMSSGSSTYYNSLHITGQGVTWKKDSVFIQTGATTQTTAEEIGVVVDNPYIDSLSKAYSVGKLTAASYAGTSYTINGTAFAINRQGDDRELIKPSIADFNDEYFGDTIADFNAQWAGQTFADFNTYWDQKFDLLWENQLFGNAPGARVFMKDAAFRITSATTTETSVQFQADLDVLVSDFNEVWAGNTIADFNANFAGYTCKDFSILPLRRNT